MISRLRITLAGVAVCVLAIPVASASTPTGPEVFRAQGCTECHSVKSASIALDKDGTLESDLSTVGATHDKRWIAGYLLKRQKKDGELHKKRFRGEKEHLKVISIWLESLK